MQSLCAAHGPARAAARRPGGASTPRARRAPLLSSAPRRRAGPLPRAAGGDAPGPRIDEPQQEASAEPQQHQQQQQQQAEERPPSPAPSAAPSDMDELLTRMAPKRAGDTADVVLMLVSVTALVALSMQLYRGYLLYQMYADKSF